MRFTIDRNVKVDFGTYHHSTLKESEELRETIREAFASVLHALYTEDSILRVLDAGCGLGFLSFVVAETFQKASIVGIDTFNHESLSGNSIVKAEENMKALGVGSRVQFVEQNLIDPISTDDTYDLVVSNLVFHNLGRRRFRAYQNVFAVLKKGGYFVIGDFFPNELYDSKYFAPLASAMKEIAEGGSGRWKYKIKVLRKR